MAKMKRIRLEKYDAYFVKKLKNKKFRKAFELERTKISLEQMISKRS